MKRYISAEKLKAEIERRMNDLTTGSDYSARCELREILTFIDSLQQEQPSLPSNLDEVAKEYDEAESWSYEALPYPRIAAFKAGAEWMAGQGETFESTVLVNGMGDSYVDGYYLTEKIPEGDKVLVQIRKK